VADTKAGHRSVPHTADLRIEAWAPTREGCIHQAVLGTVESFLDTSSARPDHTRLRRLTADRDDHLLVAVLLDTARLLVTSDAAGKGHSTLVAAGGTNNDWRIDTFASRSVRGAVMLTFTLSAGRWSIGRIRLNRMREVDWDSELKSLVDSQGKGTDRPR
jgi:SHS2 domain-containing protein